MKITINKQGTEAYISNIAFIRALLIKEYITSLPITKEEKEKMIKSILQLLKNG
jgi:hypothetical protein